MAENGVVDKSSPGENDPPSQPFFSKSATVDGDVFPLFPVKTTVADHLRSLKKMPLRQDDVIIAAFPKTGTHWLWEQTRMLIAGKAEHSPDLKEKTMLEFNEVEKNGSLPSPRLLNTHLFLRHLSQDLETKKSRVIHIIRNPKDVAVSFYFHIIQVIGVEDLGVLDFIQGFLQGGVAPGVYYDYFTYLKEMMQWQREHPDVPVLNIYYEEVKKEPVKSMERLAKFLEVEASKELCEAIADQCSFQKLKQADRTIKVKDPAVEVVFKCGAGGADRYREGEVGDWKNYFTVALSEQYDREVPEKLKGCDINFQYTI